MPVVSMIRRTRSRIGSPTARAAGAARRRAARTARAPRRSSRGRPGPRARRTATGSRSGRRPRRPPRSCASTSAKLLAAGPGRAGELAGAAAEQGEVARADRPARTGQQREQRGVGGDVLDRVRVATTSATSGSRSRPLRPTISTGISRSLSASKTAAAWALSRVRTPISCHARTRRVRGAIAACVSSTWSASQASSSS